MVVTLSPALDLSVAESAFMRGIFSPGRVTQGGPDGLSHYCPVRVICLEIPRSWIRTIKSREPGLSPQHDKVTGRCWHG